MNEPKQPKKDPTMTSDAMQQAQQALASAARPGQPGSIDRAEKELVDSVDGASQTASNSSGWSTLLDGVNALVESLPPLLRTLDALAQLHPFLQVAVGAFKVVVELEIKRHDNDKKINLLFLEMRNMMSSLLQLQGVRPNHVGHDGISIGERMDDLVKQTANDIKECANACDAYARKRLLTKVIKAPSWDATLKGYIQLFSERKGEIGFRISVHTGVQVDRANVKLDALMLKMDVVLEFFQKALPREQLVLAEVVRRGGGTEAVLSKTEVLQELLLKEQQLETGTASTQFPSYASPAAGQSAYVVPGSARFGDRPSSPRYSRTVGRGVRTALPRRDSYDYRPSGQYYSEGKERPQTAYPVAASPYMPPPASVPHSTPYNVYGSYAPNAVEGRVEGASLSSDLTRLMQDLADEPAIAIQRNLVRFERRFAIQQKEILEEMKKVVVHEGDRVIRSVLAGPHERIVDQDMYEIWKDMRWRGIVEARHLVLAIYDYYNQRLDDQQHAIASGTTPTRPIPDEDLWAVKCIDLMHLQSLMEAFDNDTSGYISVQEVNRFTTSRPKGWSLLRWLAYWAVGWQVAMTEYRRKIQNLLARMWDLRSSVLLCGKAVEGYVNTVGYYVQNITASFVEDTDRRYLLERFQEYIDQEEMRLRQGLETAKYDLDSPDTLDLINGPRGLERNVFVILYLLLSRHYDVMRLAQRVLLHFEEVSDAASMMAVVRDAFGFRVQELVGLFTQRRLLVDVEITDFACGMLSAIRNPDMAASPDMDALENLLVDGNDDLRGKLDELSDAILKHPPYLMELYPECDDLIESEGTEVAEELKPLLGKWAGVRHYAPSDDNEYTWTYTYVFHISPTDPNKLIASPKFPWTWQCTRMIAEVEFTGITEDGRRKYTIAESFNTTLLENPYLNVMLSQDGLTLEGDQDYTRAPTSDQGPVPHAVLRKDSSAEVMRFYPSPRELEKNRASALWRFAIFAILYDVRRRLFTWSFIRERGEIRRSLASLWLAEREQRERGDNLHSDDVEERARLLKNVVPADVQCVWYCSLEPAKYPWILPTCGICHRVLKTVKPCLRMVGKLFHLPSELELAVCERDDCLLATTRYPGLWPTLVLKTWTAGWTINSFLEESGLKTTDVLRKLFEDATRRVLRDSEPTTSPDELDENPLGFDKPLVPRSRPFDAPHSLSTVTELAEDAIDSGISAQPPKSNRFETSHLWAPAPSSPSSPESAEIHRHSSSLEDASKESGISPPRRTVSFMLNDGADSAHTLTEEPADIEALPACARCKSEVQLPCWICSQCTRRIFVPLVIRGIPLRTANTPRSTL
ncbi:hypothetical protein GY45DRAFT_365739 [Cubamyces sp. BRFM 1775]|nr:hypothetical protein GY45DRAFT_365739 [Cubamyces sp. BRFM 1775]